VEDLPAGAFDVVTAFECLHDLPFPDAALRAIRGALAPGGVLLVADLRAEPEARFPSGGTERLLYGFSIGVCLPDAMATPGSAQTGTLMRPGVLARLARDAGFTALEEAPVEHDLWRFTVLRP
jgi:2-polyprenyl-3-methyl-5-hydroxy-6-metoxy-1,4-benzoquinol methylase